MRSKNLIKLAVLTACLILTISAGCLRNNQLEQVAKDWALVIRASQVIPVYPLSEDLQPGDILLVSTPLEEQMAEYQKKGFLPLDQLLVRLYSDPDMIKLYSSDFKDFYSSRYGITDKSIPPGNWQTSPDSWKTAPLAAFPTYQFSVKTGSGFNLAIPIQGVPFALGLMNSGSASGTVTITDAHTFGLDRYRLDRIVYLWALKNRGLLRNYENHFLRVISRVYVAGGVNVTIQNDEAAGVNGSAATNSPVNLMGIKENAASENYTDIINAINNLIKSQLPGAEIKVATATSRSVTLSETFAKPLVIGYIGFDIPILKEGQVGGQISTLDQLTRKPILQSKVAPATEIIFNSYRLAALAQTYEALTKTTGKEADALRAKLDTLDKLLPNTYPFSLYTRNENGVLKDQKIVTGAKIEEKGFRGLLSYLGNAFSTIEILENHPNFSTDSQLAQELQSARTALGEIKDRLAVEPVLLEMIDFVFLNN
jgi:hypothetical protein